MNKRRMLLHRSLLTAGIFLLAAPVFLLLGAAVEEARPLRPLPVLGAALLLAFLARLLPGKLRLPGGVLAMLCAALLAALWGKGTSGGAGYWLLSALSAAMAGIHLWVLCRPWGEEVALPVWPVGGTVYLAVRILGATAGLRTLTAPLRALLLIYLVFLTFMLMIESLRDGSGDGKYPSGRMLGRNCGMALLFSALLLLLTHLPAVTETLRKALAWAVSEILYLISLLRLPGSNPMGEGMEEGGWMGALEGGREPSPFWQAMEKILYFIGAALACLLALALLWLLCRACARGIKKLMEKLRAYAGTVTDAYEDTVESLLDWGEVRRAARESRKRRAAGREKGPPWEKLTPREKVRRSYRAFLRRHPDIPDGRTARQVLGETGAADIYEKARYSSLHVSPEEAERCAPLLKKDDF